MTPLRKKMIEAMRMHGFSARTHETYLMAVSELARYHRGSPSTLEREELERFFRYLVMERNLSPASCRLYLNAVRFLYVKVLNWPALEVSVTVPKRPQRIPELLTRVEIAQIFAHCDNPKHRMMPVTYHHVVFTVPAALNPWVARHGRSLYAQLFASAWATLAAFCARHRRLGGQGAMSAVLHTWGQTLTRHVHLHCLVPAGVLTETGEWRALTGAYLFAVRALSRRPQGHFVAGLRRRARTGELHHLDPGEIDAMLDALMATDWVVYTKPCLGHTGRVVDYLARYTHRIALTNARLVGIEGDKVGLPLPRLPRGRRAQDPVARHRRAPSPLPAPRPAQGLHARAPLRLPRQPLSRPAPAAHPRRDRRSARGARGATG